MPARVGGIIHLMIDGAQYAAKGDFTYNAGTPKREAVVGADAVHGYKETPQVAFIEGAITDGATVDLTALTKISDSTVLLNLANGKSFVLRNAWFAGDGEVSTAEGEIKVRFEGLSGEELS